MRPKLFTGICSILLAVLLGGSARAGLHSLGMNYEDLSQTAPAHEVKSVPIAAGAQCYRNVLRVDLTDQMPPVGNQGGQGSCASWAATYYHRTQLEYKERRWDLTNPRHRFSPAFTYNQINGGADRGSGFSNNFGLMCEQGAASMADMPYNDRDPVSWPTEQAFYNAIPFRCKDWRWSYTRDSSGIAVIKQLLNNGFTSCLAIWVWGNFDNIHLFNYIYCSADRGGSNRGGHMVTIVGYDDTLTTRDGPGAFRMVNSWGTGWGQNGYFWMSYAAVMDGFLSMQVVGWLEDTVGYVPQMYARVRINHPARDRMGISFMVGPRETPLWFRDFRGWRSPGVDQPFPSNKIVFDLTDGSDYIRDHTTDSVFVCCYDDLPDDKFGEVTYYSAQYLPWGNIIPSRETPLAIPDTWQMVYALASVRQYDPDVTLLDGPTPTGIYDSSQTAVPQALVGNFSRAAATFPVVMRIGNTYCDTQMVTNLAPRDTMRVFFRTWTAPTRGLFRTRCSTALATDQYPENDYNDDSVSVRVRDIGITAIEVPPDTVDTAAMVFPKVRLRNYGTTSEQVRGIFRIPGDGYFRSGQKSIEPGAETTLTFPYWKTRTPGTHLACCTLQIAGDVNPANNAMSKYVTVFPGAGIEEDTPRASRFLLEAETNPFRGSVVLRLPAATERTASILIYDASGCLIRSFSAYGAEHKTYRVTWDGRNSAGRIAPAGAYFCRLESGRRRTTISLLKLD